MSDWVTHNRLAILERKVMTLKGLFRQLGHEANGLRELGAVALQPMALWDGVQGGTQPPTTAPPTTGAPGTTAPGTTAPATTVPSTTMPSTTAPPTTAPATTGVATTGPATTVPPCPDCAAPPRTVAVTVTSATDPACESTWVLSWYGNESSCWWYINQGGTEITLYWTGVEWQLTFTGNCVCGTLYLAAANCNTGASGAGCGGTVTVTP